MYEGGQEGPLSDQLLVYACLSNICSHLSNADQEVDAASYFEMARFFSNLLLQALATFPMMMPGSADVLEALVVAVCFGIGWLGARCAILISYRDLQRRECVNQVYHDLCRAQLLRSHSLLATPT